MPMPIPIGSVPYLCAEAVSMNTDCGSWVLDRVSEWGMDWTQQTFIHSGLAWVFRWKKVGGEVLLCLFLRGFT